MRSDIASPISEVEYGTLLKYITRANRRKTIRPCFPTLIASHYQMARPYPLGLHFTWLDTAVDSNVKDDIELRPTLVDESIGLQLNELLSWLGALNCCDLSPATITCAK